MLLLSFQLELKHIEVAALTKKKHSSYQERLKIYYKNYAASITQKEWDDMEEKEKDRIKNMGKGKRSL